MAIVTSLCGLAYHLTAERGHNHFQFKDLYHFQHRIRTLNGVEELDMYLHLHLMRYGGI